MRLVIEIIFLCFVVFIYGVAYGKIRFGRLQSAQPEETQFFNEDAINLQPTCNQFATNCVSRQAAIDAAIDAVDDWEGCTNIGRQKRIENYINKLPFVQPEHKKGKWIFHEPFDCGKHNCNPCIECSCCKTWFGTDCYAKSNFCPNCGAEMTGVKDD